MNVSPPGASFNLPAASTDWRDPAILFAGALFPIAAMPAPLAAIAKVAPLTHALALLRCGFIDPGGKGLHDIWGMSNTELGALRDAGSLGGLALSV